MQSQKQLKELSELSENRVCRICLEQDNATMISPCACTGTIKHVHQKCMEIWISNPSVTVKQKNNGHWVECELCRSQIECMLKPMNCGDFCKTNKKIIVLTVFCIVAIITEISVVAFLIVRSVQNQTFNFSAIFIGSCVVLVTLFALKILHDGFSYRKTKNFTVKQSKDNAQNNEIVIRNSLPMHINTYSLQNNDDFRQFSYKRH